ncbi:hypothetical protein SCUCBS95973_006037 [Sporothrix curviconia]|uniref:Major facilitator superfamily (MFS) profile domain-containing protein n=1 Tax=Sporothrix curviconia TaxID=1260050 RepID=A0ABP0C2S0_9PEZI
MQIIGGTTLRSYATYFFEEAVWPPGTVDSQERYWFIMPYVGRRTLFLWGVYVNTAIFFIIGGLGMQPNNNSFVWTIAALLVVNAFFSCVCMEPVVFALVPDIPSTVLRSKTVPIGRFVYSVINIPLSILTSYMINSSAWGWGAKDGFFWAGLGVLGTKDRTDAELDLLFEKKVPAWKFSTTEFHASEIGTKLF